MTTAADNGGWVKLWRKLMDSPLMRMPGHLQLAVALLLRAAHAETTVIVKAGRTFHRVTLQPGELVFGRDEWARLLRAPGRTLHKRLASLGDTHGFCTVKPTSNYTIVSICNWHLYQSCDDTPCQQSGQQGDNMVTAKGQQGDTYKNTKKMKNDEELRPPVAPHEPDSARQQRSPVAPKRAEDAAIPEGLDTPEFREAWAGYIQARHEMFCPLTGRAAQLLFADFAKLPIADCVAMLDQATKGGWKSLHPLSEARYRKEAPADAEKYAGAPALISTEGEA